MALALRELPTVPASSEHSLVRAVRRGDDRAFEELFARYRRRVSAYVYGLVGDHGRAEDITQEVFISALRRLRETEAPIAFRPWIYEIARNACIDEFRRTQRANLVSLDENRGEREAQVPLLPEDSSPEARFEAKQRIGNLFGAFSGLSDNHHRILIMREFEGLSYGEIGQRLGMSRPVVESTLFRARRRLSEEYSELSSGRRCQDVRAAVDEQEQRALASLGIRQRRRIARHVAHCGDCLRYARMAGVDATALAPSPARRVAALLPFGWLRGLVGRGGSRAGGSARAAHQASALVESGPPAVAAGRAVSAAVALLITGGTLSGLGGPSAHHPAGRGTRAVPPAASAGVHTVQGAPGPAIPPLIAAPARASSKARGHGARVSAGGSGGHSGGGSTYGGSVPPGGPGGGGRSVSPAGSPSASSLPGAAGSGGTTGQLVNTAGTVLGQLTGPGGVTGTVTKLVSQGAGAVGSTLAQTGSAVGNVVSQTGTTAGRVLSQTGGAVATTSAPVAGGAAAPVAKALDTAGTVVAQTGQTAGKVTTTLTGLPSALLGGHG